MSPDPQCGSVTGKIRVPHACVRRRPRVDFTTSLRFDAQSVVVLFGQERPIALRRKSASGLAVFTQPGSKTKARPQQIFSGLPRKGGN
jgi:hypothetical protein